MVSLCSPEPLAPGSGSCVSWMADPGVRRPAAEAGAGQDCRGVRVSTSGFLLALYFDFSVSLVYWRRDSCDI
jgi:hypothetical protein